MVPIRSNSNKENCSPISSNCVVWRGPDLPCINLCKGDSVSDVVYKTAVEVCQLKEDLGLSDIDLTCLVQVCQTTPEPEKTLTNILTLLVNKVCCLSDIVKNIPNPGTPYVEPTISLTSYCAELTANGVLTSLVLSDLVKRIATVLCNAWAEINRHTTILGNHETRIYNLEHPTISTVNIQSCLTGTLEQVDVALINLETLVCDYKSVLGTPTDINVVSTEQCNNLTQATPSLSTGDPMGVLYPDWNPSPSTLAQSLQNLWFTVCDIRGAVKIIQDTCCKVDCESIVINFGSKWISDDVVNLYFFPDTLIPASFYDCNQTVAPVGSTFTFTDALGNTYQKTFLLRHQDYVLGNLTGVVDNPTYQQNGYPVSGFSTSLLDTSTTITVSGNICFTDGTTKCIKCITVTIPPYTGKCCEIRNTSTTESLTVIYSI